MAPKGTLTQGKKKHKKPDTLCKHCDALMCPPDHLGCSTRAYTCFECGDMICSNCTEYCERAESKYAENPCQNMGKPICPLCVSYCAVCEGYFCYPCTFSCAECDDSFCLDCSRKAGSTKCDSCGQRCCDEDCSRALMHECSSCDATMCKDCNGEWKPLKDLGQPARQLVCLRVEHHVPQYCTSSPY